MPTGTVDLIGTIKGPVIALPISRATPSTMLMSAEPSSDWGVPTAMKITDDSRTAFDKVAVKVSRFSSRFLRTISSSPGS